MPNPMGKIGGAADKTIVRRSADRRQAQWIGAMAYLTLSTPGIGGCGVAAGCGAAGCDWGLPFDAVAVPAGAVSAPGLVSAVGAAVAVAVGLAGAGAAKAPPTTPPRMIIGFWLPCLGFSGIAATFS